MYSTLESEIRKVTRAVVRCYIGEDLKVCVYVVDVYYDICQRLKLEGETENMGVCTKERKGVTAAVLMATEGCINNGSKQKARPKGVNLKVH